MLKLGVIGLDGTKIHANASRHSALSYDPGGQEAQLKEEVADLLAKAEAADKADVPDGLSIPDELARRDERLTNSRDSHPVFLRLAGAIEGAGDRVRRIQVGRSFLLPMRARGPTSSR
jgi:hypothetical protein